MRIAFHVPRASHLKTGYSGDKILVRGLIDGLSRRGHDVQVVSRLNIRNVWRGRVPRDELVSEMRRVRMDMQRFAPDVWIVYGASTTNPDLFGWRMSDSAASRPQRYLMLATDLGSGRRVPLRWRRLFAWAHRRSLATADWIAAYHPSSHDDLVQHGGIVLNADSEGKHTNVGERCQNKSPGGIRHDTSAQRIVLLPPAVSPWGHVTSMHDARRRLGLPAEAPVLFCASRFPCAEERGDGKMQMLLDLVTASTSLPPEAIVVIAGDGPGRSVLEQAISSVQLRCAIRLAGPVEHVQMPIYFAACDLFVYPHQVDRPWLAVLEAQSCGRPVVAMHTRSSELTICPGETGLLASDLESFRRAIGTLAADRQMTQTMGLAAARYVAENHSLEVRLDQIERQLKEPKGGLAAPKHRDFRSNQLADCPQATVPPCESIAGIKTSSR